MAIGSFAANGDPTLDIEIVGLGKTAKLTCLVDTGFTGFLSIPLLQALPLGLVLAGTTTVTFANGASEPRLTFLSQARIDGQERFGIVFLEFQSSQVLLGMDFLRVFGLKLLVCPTTGQIEVVPSGSGFTVPAANPATPGPAQPPSTSD